jgi:RHS repeat-associated protein
MTNFHKTACITASQNAYSIVQIQYDPLGHAYRTSNPFTSTAQYWTETDYDVLDRPTKVIAPDNSTLTYVYSTNSVVVTDPTGKQKKILTDGLGRTSGVYEPDPNNGNSLTQYTSYAYTVMDDLTSVSEGQQTRTYVFDGLRRLTSLATPETANAAILYRYNDLDLVTQRTDVRGVITNYTFDTLNRPTGISYTLPSGSQVALMPNVCNPVVGQTTPVANVCFYYDEGGTGANAVGHLTHMAFALGNQQNSPSATQSYQYDTIGRITQVQNSLAGQTYTISYQYNSADGLTSITYPSNRVVQQTYDGIGRLSKIADSVATYLTIPTPGGYNAANEILSLNYGNGITENLQYSPDRLQLTSLSYIKGASTIFSLTYSYGSAGSNNGQISGITDNVDNGRTVSYVYDALARITNATTVGSTNYPKWGLSWTYDRYGNRTAQSISSGCSGLTCPTNSVTVSATTNRISGSPYAYDANGNMTNDGLNALTYDAENRAVSATGSLGAGTYVFDPNGLRIEKISSGATTVYVFAGSKVIAEYASGAAPGSPSKEYIYSGSQLIATIAGTTTTYQLSDHLSVRANTDTSGNILKDGQGNDIGSQGHFPFGETWYIGSGGTKWQFAGYERDRESINDYAVARSFVNRLGRFTSPDLFHGYLANPQSLNRYVYALNDPCNVVDPLGLAQCNFKIGLVNDVSKDFNKDKVKALENQINQILGATTTTGDSKGDTVGIQFVDSGKTAATLTITNASVVTNFLLGSPMGVEGGFWGGPKIYFNNIPDNLRTPQMLAGVGSHELAHKLLGEADQDYDPKNPNTMMYDKASEDVQFNALTHLTDPKNPKIDPIFKLTKDQVKALFRKCQDLLGGGGGSTGTGPTVWLTFYTACGEGGCSIVITGVYIFWPPPPVDKPTL